MYLFLSLVFLAAGELLADDGTIACDPELRPAVITEPGTVFSQAGYDGSSPYAPNMTCEYRFIGQAGQSVILEFSDFVLEECTDCKCDYVELYDGQDDSGVLLEKVCGSPTTPFTLNGGQDAFLRFVSDASTQGTGFQGTFDVGNPACEGGVIIRSMNGTITSPEYPSNYPTLTDCTWTIEVPDSSYYVNLQFDACSIESCSTSLYDYLDFTELDTNNRLAKWFGDCPDDPGFVFSNYNGGSSVELYFHSDISITRGGFSLRFEVVQRE